MKSSEIISKINNRITLVFPLIIISGFLSFMFMLCNLALIITGGTISQLINGTTIPFEIGLSIPLFVVLLIYYNKLASILNRIEERS